MTIPEAAIEAAAHESAKHVHLISSRSMQEFPDDGGSKCSCGEWAEGPEPQGFRPWFAWHLHVQRNVLEAALPYLHTEWENEHE